jgi:hypothetical protein
MMERITGNISPKTSNATRRTLLKRRRWTNNLILIIFMLFLALISFSFSSVSAQTSQSPEPQLPKNGATYIDVTSIPFSWTSVVGTSEYKLELSKNIDFSADVFKATIRNSTAYVYRGTLEYKTTYYWRVMAEPLGDWSAVSIFSTKASSSASTNNTTSPPQDSTKKSSLLSYLENIGWPIVGVIAAVIVAVIVALVVLLKPKRQIGDPRQYQVTQPPPFMQQPSACSACGSPNTPDRKFCINCGTNLLNQGPQQTWGPPSGQQQTITCPTCGFPNNTPDRKFCGNCGANLVSTWQQSSQRTQQQAYQVYQTYSCPVCGAPIVKGNNPCPNCRTWLDWGAY